jgi:hypothetical protein
MNITPHVAQNTTNRRSAVDERTTRHAGYEVSQRKRKRVEQSFGWMKMIGMLKKVKLRWIDKVGWLFTFTGRPISGKGVPGRIFLRATGLGPGMIVPFNCAIREFYPHVKARTLFWHTIDYCPDQREIPR